MVKTFFHVGVSRLLVILAEELPDFGCGSFGFAGRPCGVQDVQCIRRSIIDLTGVECVDMVTLQVNSVDNHQHATRV